MSEARELTQMCARAMLMERSEHIQRDAKATILLYSAVIFPPMFSPRHIVGAAMDGVLVRERENMTTKQSGESEQP